jgi:drug/metabolite transporter (DMT)-like permease
MMSEDPLAYAFLENLLTGLVFIPFAIFAWSIPQEQIAWALLFISCMLWTAIAIVSMYSYKYTAVSLRAPISETRTFWLLLFSVLILSEVITYQKFFGVSLIFIGVIIIKFKKGLTYNSFFDKGVLLTLVSALLSALTAIVDKKSMQYFTEGFYGMIVYLVPAVFIGIYISRKKIRDVKLIISKKLPWLFAVMILGFVYYYFQLAALKLAEVSIVYPILRLSTLFTVVGGIIFLNERENIVRKIIATIVVIAGVILVSGYMSF